LTTLPDEFNDDLRFAVLDNSDPETPDFFYHPLMFLESFNAPAIVLNIDGWEIPMPIDWRIAVGDSESGCDVEILPLTSLNDRGFEALCFNPLSSFRLEFKPIEVVNFYNDVKWHVPKIKTGNLLAVPINKMPKSLCCFFIKEVTRQGELIDLSKIL